MAEDSQRVSVTFSGDDLRVFRQFMTDAGYTNPNVAVRALVAGALVDYPTWGVFTAEHRAAYWEFRVLMKEEFAKKLLELKRAIDDDIALMRAGHGHAD